MRLAKVLNFSMGALFVNDYTEVCVEGTPNPEIP